MRLPRTIAINNLPKSILSPSALYADDCCFWKIGANIEQLYHLCQTYLNKIAAWCTKWGFRASLSKFNQMTKQLWPNDHFNARTLLIPNKPVWLILRPNINLHMQAYSHASNQTVIRFSRPTWTKAYSPQSTELHPVSRTPTNSLGYAPDIAVLTVTSTASASIQPAVVNNNKSQN